MNDKERFAWLLEEYERHGTIEIELTTQFDPNPNCCQLFTVSSQHVYGKDMREAIDAAMNAEPMKWA